MRKRRWVVAGALVVVGVGLLNLTMGGSVAFDRADPSVHAVEAHRSVAYLKALQLRIGAELPAPLADRVQTIAIDVERGQVQLGVVSATAADQQLVDERYGGDVRVVDSAPITWGEAWR